MLPAPIGTGSMFLDPISKVKRNHLHLYIVVAIHRDPRAGSHVVVDVRGIEVQQAVRGVHRK